MGGCCSCDNTPDVPAEIIPDPSEDESIEVTVQKCGWSGLSRDYEAFKSLDKPVEENRWLFLNKSGSKRGRECEIAVENYVREDPENPKLGQVLWKAKFFDSPYFQQQLRDPNQPNMASMFMGFVQDSRRWGNDAYYMNRHTGWSSFFDPITLYINWTMQTSADLEAGTRKNPYGAALKLGVYACGTSVARYNKRRETIQDSEGRVIGHKEHWEKDVAEYVDAVHFVVANAATQAPVALPDGSPAAWMLPGDASDWVNNYDTPFFKVRQEGGWFTKQPPQLTTRPGLDPILGLLLGHLATSEFSARAIKEDYRPEFPYDPHKAVFGMLNSSPPPPQVIVINQPPIVTTTTTVVQPEAVPTAQPVGQTAVPVAQPI